MVTHSLPTSEVCSLKPRLYVGKPRLYVGKPRLYVGNFVAAYREDLGWLIGFCKHVGFELFPEAGN